MARIHSLKISNYRCIKKFSQVFGDLNTIYIIGRGDSGKTTILNAIKAVLSPSWNYSFSEYDFYKGNVSSPIIIEVVLKDVPEILLRDTKYGLHYQLLSKGDRVISDVESDEADQDKKVLVVKLQVDASLEPTWEIVSGRDSLGNISFSAKDRALINMYMISDYIDSHFTYKKGSPLYALQSNFNSNGTQAQKTIQDTLTKILQNLNENELLFPEFSESTSTVKEAAKHYGIELDEIKAALDISTDFASQSSIYLNSNGIPLRLKGKGTKRLISLALQQSLKSDNSIILIDEIEQGLEPDRARTVSNLLNKQKSCQIFLTTHSRDVILEPGIGNIFLMKDGCESMLRFDSSLQGLLRKSPEAFFCKSIICCEGATEVGIIRGIDQDRQSTGNISFSGKGIIPVDCCGDGNVIHYAKQFNSIGFRTLVFCDNDVENTKKEKIELENQGIKVVNCESGNSIEQQFFNDIPWEGIVDLINYTCDERDNVFPIGDIKDLSELNNMNDEARADFRKQAGLRAKNEKHAWFKRIDHGEFLAKILLRYIDVIGTESVLKQEYNRMLEWIDE